MNEHKSVPNIRFNGFENKWGKKQLNQIVKKVTRKNSKLQTDLSLTISADRGIINQNLFFNRQIASRDMSNYFLIKQGEFAYNKSYSKSAPFGTIKRLNRYNQGALSSLYIVFCPTKANSDYLVSYFDSSYWYKQLSMISTEGVRNHGLLNVSSNDFFDMNLSIPHDDKEQQKIGEFFAKLDKLLVLQQQKIYKLELLKKALLQKLFPKHDAKIPELRFKGFNDEWKEKNLSQIVKKITRKNSKLETSLPLTISADRGMINQNLFFNRQIASEDMSNYFLVKNGDFAYNKSYSRLAPFGTIKRLDKYDQGALSSLYIVFRPTKVDSNYLVSYFDSSCWYKQLSMISTEGVRNHGLLNVSSNDFFKMILSIPRENTEQQKIGNLLSKVDQLIELENKKMHNLQQVKKCLLQNMFVE